MDEESYLSISLRRNAENYGARHFYKKTSKKSEISDFVNGLFSLIESQIIDFDVVEAKNASSCCFRLQYKENGAAVECEFDIQIENDRVIISEGNLRPITVIVKEPSKIVEYIYEYSKKKITTFDSRNSEDNSDDKQYGTINGLTKTDVIEFEFKNSADNTNYISKNVATPGKTVKATFEKYKENKYKSTYILKLSGALGEVSLWEMNQSSLSGDAELFSNNIPISFGSYRRCDGEDLIMHDTLAPYDNYGLKLVFKDNDIYEVLFDNTKCSALKYTQLTDDKKLAEEFVEKDKETIIRDAQECADTLYDFGLFKGTDKGYELEKSLTREESATILVRLLGEEEKVAADDFDEVFVDVDKDRWSYAYVMYCYKHNITKGTGADTFSPDVQIDANQFITLMMRLLGYTEVNPDTALEKSVEYKLLPEEKIDELTTKKVFTRSDMVQIVYNSLKTQMDDETVFADYLLEKGILTEEEIEQIK